MARDDEEAHRDYQLPAFESYLSLQNLPKYYISQFNDKIPLCLLKLVAWYIKEYPVHLWASQCAGFTGVLYKGT